MSTRPTDPTTASLERVATKNHGPQRLDVRWSKRHDDLLYQAPDAPDGHLLHQWISCTPGPLLSELCTALANQGVQATAFQVLKALAEVERRTLRAELEARGYDITTLRFQIDRKKDGS